MATLSSLPERYCAGFCHPVSPYPPGFPIPSGYLLTRRVDSEPGELVWNRLPVAPVKSKANGDTAVRFDLPIRQLNLEIKLKLRFH